VLVVAGDHGVAARGVSAYPSAVTAQMVSTVLAGGAAINVLAGLAGASVRVLDLAVDTAPGAAPTPELVRALKVRDGSGSIDREDALSTAEVAAAVAAGRVAVEEEVDAGTDLLVLGDLGIGNTTVAAVLVAALTDTEPVAVVGRGTGIDDDAWMRKAAAVRDALRRARPVATDPLALLRTVGGADVAAMVGALAQAAVRRTPVVLDGVVVGAAAMLAQRLAPGASDWWVAGHLSAEPAHVLALADLGLDPLLDLDLRLGEGTGGALAVPLLTAAVRLLGEVATFDEAGVSTADEQPGPVPG
jgi:nicotinate-nucleotide--dimethylbenzimidazole phosphoribosyltransferase